MHCISYIKVCVVSAMVMVVVVVAVVDANAIVRTTLISDQISATDVAKEKISTRNTIYLFPGTKTVTVLHHYILSVAFFSVILFFNGKAPYSISPFKTRCYKTPNF